MSEYTFRPWQDGDDLQLLQIWADAENSQQAAFRATLAADSDTSPWRRTLIATHRGIPVAAGTVYESSLHHRHLWVYLEVAPDHRRQGVGTALLSRLRKLAETSPSGVNTLRAKVEEGSAGAEFALAAGLKQIQHSYIVRVAAGSVPVVPLRHDDDGQPTQAVEDIATGSVELTEKFWDFYRRSHRWDPPAELSLGRVNRLFLSEEADAYGAIVLRDRVQQARRQGKRGKILAFAVSYRPLEADMPGFEVPDDHATEVLVGYDFDGEAATEAIVQLLSLLTAQYPVTLEVDEAMGQLWAVVEKLLSMGSATVQENMLVLADA